jgi:hypothetical protein
VDAKDSVRESGLSESFTPIRCMAAIFTGPTWRGRNSVLRLYAGQCDIAIEHVEKSLRLNPLDRMGAPLTAIAAAHFFKREFGV